MGDCGGSAVSGVLVVDGVVAASSVVGGEGAVVDVDDGEAVFVLSEGWLELLQTDKSRRRLALL